MGPITILISGAVRKKDNFNTDMIFLELYTGLLYLIVAILIWLGEAP